VQIGQQRISDQIETRFLLLQRLRLSQPRMRHCAWGGYELVSMACTHVDTQVRNLVKMALGRSTGFSDKSVRLAAFPDAAAVLLYVLCLGRH
jgi:hypothetical protein